MRVMGHQMENQGAQVNPILAITVNIGAILLARIERADVVLFLQAISLIGASCVAFVTFYEKVTSNHRLMGHLVKTGEFISCIWKYLRLGFQVFRLGVKWAYNHIFKNK